MGRSYQTFPAHAGRPHQSQALDPAMQGVVDFIRARLLNFAVAGLLTVVYLLYQYWGLLFEQRKQEAENAQVSKTRSRSRTRERDDKRSSRHSSRRYSRDSRY